MNIHWNHLLPEFHEHQVITAWFQVNLINAGIDMLTRDGVGFLLVYGDPAYYGRFGFKEEIGYSFLPPYTLQYPFGWTGMMLNDTHVPEKPIQFECVSALSKPELW